jgi:hypothetical protein
MKIFMFAGCAAILAGGIYFQGGPAEANVYGLPLKDTYAKLRASEVPQSEGARAAGVTVTLSGNPGKYVMWSTRGSHVGYDCKAHLIPVDAQSTRIIPVCEGGGAGEGAAAGMAMKMRVNAFIERIDATMTDRPYDKERAIGSTAARWPKQEISNSDIFSAQAEALKMHAEVQAGIEDAESGSN